MGELEVPLGARPGTAIRFSLPGGSQCQAEVPEGYAPGQTFQVQVPFAVEEPTLQNNLQFQVQNNFQGVESKYEVPQAMMTLTVQVPPGSAPGTLVGFRAPNGSHMQAKVPDGVAVGKTFQVQIPQMAPQMPQQIPQLVPQSVLQALPLEMPQQTELTMKKSKKKNKEFMCCA